MKTFKENRIFVVNDPTAPRLSPDLAMEISEMLEGKSGVNESLLLLQIEFWIAVNGVWKEGKKWYYRSSRDIADFFKIMSDSTVQRSLNNLESLRLIEIGNYNKRRSDKTPWFTLNFEGLSNLKSISLVKQNACFNMKQAASKRSTLLQNEAGLFSNEAGLLQSEAGFSQNEATLQEIYENKEDLSKKKDLKESLFEIFWHSFYPHDRRGSILKAKEYYKKLILKPGQHELLMQCLKNYKQTKSYQDGCIVTAHRFITEYENYTKLSKY